MEGTRARVAASGGGARARACRCSATSTSRTCWSPAASPSRSGVAPAGDRGRRRGLPAGAGPRRARRRWRTGAQPTVLVDYAHTPDAVDKLLRTLRPLTRGRLVTVFGCGGDRDRAKRPLMAEAVARWSDLAVATSDNPRSEDPRAILADVERGLGKLERVEPEALGAADRAYAMVVDRRAAIALAIGLARAGRHRRARRQGPRGLPDRRPRAAALRRPRRGAPRRSRSGARDERAASRSRRGGVDGRAAAPGSPATELRGRLDRHAHARRRASSSSRSRARTTTPTPSSPRPRPRGRGGLLIVRGRPLPAERDARAARDRGRRHAPGRSARWPPGTARASHGPVVAITGSNGKTTTKEMCAAILGCAAPCLKTQGNLNNEFGLPLTLLRRRERRSQRRGRDRHEPPRRDRAARGDRAADRRGHHERRHRAHRAPRLARGDRAREGRPVRGPARGRHRRDHRGRPLRARGPHARARSCASAAAPDADVRAEQARELDDGRLRLRARDARRARRRPRRRARRDHAAERAGRRGRGAGRGRVARGARRGPRALRSPRTGGSSASTWRAASC